MSLRDLFGRHGLAAYVERFEAEQVGIADLEQLQDDDLRDGFGMVAYLDRKRFRAMVASLAENSAWPADLRPDDLPTWLAHPWRELCTERHPRVRLHWMLDLAELIVRWTVAVCLAEVLAANGGALPPAVLNAIAEHVERPTLGRWLRIMEALRAAAPAAPRVARGLFEWAGTELAPRFAGEGEGATVETSFLVLRNQTVHGGVVGRSVAERMVQAHLGTVVQLLDGLRMRLSDAVLVADGVRLVGLQPTPTDGPWTELRGAWLVAPGATLPLDPMVYYGPVWHVGADGQASAKAGPSVAQIYARGDRDRLTYTTIGTEDSHSLRFDVQAFRDLFQLDRRERSRLAVSADGFAWDTFIAEARVHADDLVGRAAELAVVKSWLKQRDVWAHDVRRIGWISAGPGVGKSMVMAQLAVAYAQPKHRGLYFHRFRAGDSRNSRDVFLRLLLAALASWEPLASLAAAIPREALTGPELEQAVRTCLEAIARIEPPSARAPRAPFWIFIDGMDEVVALDPRIPELVKSLAVPGTLWLLAGRPERSLEAAFHAESCDRVFRDGLPTMTADDIRAMLVVGLGSARYALLRRDEDLGEDGVRNRFVESVVSKARGLPLYVHLLLADIRAGHVDLREGSEDRLPDGLTAYYEAMVRRLGPSTASHDLTEIVAVLACGTEGLDAGGMALVLAKDPRKVGRYLERVEVALRLGAALVRRTATPDTEDAWTLYHQSFREFVQRSDDLRGSVEEARETLADLASQWTALGGDVLRPFRRHLFRHGTEYALWWKGAEGVAEVHARLTDFAYLQARTAELAAFESADLANEQAALLGALGGAGSDVQRAFTPWEAFFRERTHLLRRGDAACPANRVLLQLAMEHADDSPVTAAAERWLASGACDFLWLRSPERPAHVATSSCVRVFEGHDGPIAGAFLHAGRSIVSWSEDRTVRVWRLDDGEQAAVLDGHSGPVRGCVPWTSDTVVSWSVDGALHVWDVSAATGSRLLAGHADEVIGVRVLPDGGLLSWSHDRTVRLWGTDGVPTACLRGHGGAVLGALQLSDGGFLSWSADADVRLWGPDGSVRAVHADHVAPVRGALLLEGGGILTWSDDGRVHLLAADGHLQARLHAHVGGVVRVIAVPGGFASCGRDGAVQLWEVADDRIRRLGGMGVHGMAAAGIAAAHGGCAVSWAHDGTVGITDAGGTRRVTAHGGVVCGAAELGDGRWVSWSRDHTLRAWSERGGPEHVLRGHTEAVEGAFPCPDGRVLSWSLDGTLRLWSVHVEGQDVDAAPSEADESNRVDGALTLPEGRVLCWTSAGGVRLVDGTTGQQTLALAGHAAAVLGGARLRDGRLLTWSVDGSVRVWRADTVQPVRVLRGHEGAVLGAVELSCGDIVSWSTDGTLRRWDGSCGVLLDTVPLHAAAARGGELADAVRGALDARVSRGSSRAGVRARIGDEVAVWHADGQWAMIGAGGGSVLVHGQRRLRVLQAFKGAQTLAVPQDRSGDT